MWAALVLEHEPMRLAELPAYALAWLHTVGGLSALVFLVARAFLLLRRHPARRNILLNVLAVLVIVFYGTYFVLQAQADSDGSLSNWSLSLGAGAALLGILWPFLRDIATRLRWGRIWALASLSLKEAVRSKVLILFALLALLFLFMGWFVGYKQEDQVRNYVVVIYRSMSLVFMATFTFLGAFSIPTDIKRQNIHTIATKPVEKIEIVLGRFLGFGLLMTMGLAAWTALSYGYLYRGITPEAAYESFKARVPVFAQLDFYPKGTSVGREHDYRRYISGPHPSSPVGTPREFAIFTFPELPALQQESVPFEFTFDIFRLTKGTEEGKGIFCSFLFTDPRYTVFQIEEALDRVRRQRIDLRKKSVDPLQIEQKLLEDFRIHEHAGFELFDYHTNGLKVPQGFFQALQKAQQTGFKVFFNIDRSAGSNMVGMAQRDMYMLADVRSFAQNFIKGILALWLLFLLAMGVAIALSTYLSAVISWLATLFLLLVGLPLDYIKDLANNKATEGGPFISMLRIKEGIPLGASVDDRTGADVAQGLDSVFQWYLRQYLVIIPDVSRFDLNVYVGNGFDAPWIDVMLLHLLLYWLAYMIPWLVLAYYLLKFREIALPT